MTKPNLLQSAIAGVSGLWRRRPADDFEAEIRSADPERRSRGLFRRGRLHMRAGETAEAAADFERALELVPDYAEAIAARAESSDMAGDVEAAGREYARARRIWAAQRPGTPDRRYVFRRPGRFSFEVDSYELALQRIKTGAFPHLACGNAFLVQGRPADALRCYDNALKIKQNDPDLIALRGEALSALGRYREAIKAFDAALSANPRDVESLNARGIAYMAHGRLQRANEDWRRQLELLPDAQSAARACVAMRLADYSAALPELERAAAREPDETYWKLYQLTALKRLERPIGEIEPARGDTWPGLLIDLHLDRIAEAQARAQATTPERLAELAFQLGQWKEATQHSPPSLIEHAAARNELAHR
ncbi:MAG: tetratricopeptide repeat protein [Enhydrobacter sp.]|nr:MAG: tetratricopeptide repeat protein [Enhydrobacter sp.]